MFHVDTVVVVAARAGHWQTVQCSVQVAFKVKVGPRVPRVCQSLERSGYRSAIALLSQALVVHCPPMPVQSMAMQPHGHKVNSSTEASSEQHKHYRKSSSHHTRRRSVVTTSQHITAASMGFLPPTMADSTVYLPVYLAILPSIDCNTPSSQSFSVVIQPTWLTTSMSPMNWVLPRHQNKRQVLLVLWPDVPSPNPPEHLRALINITIPSLVRSFFNRMYNI